MKSVSMAAMALALALTAAPAAAQTGMPSPLPAEVLADAPDAAAVDWLKSRIVVSGAIGGGLSFAFPESFYANRLFLLGESHGSAAPQVLDLELLAHLNARIGLVDYVAEVDPVQGDRLNAYLASGDEAVLDRVFDYWTQAGLQWGNGAFEDKVRGIRALNQTLPEARRIRFIGIDAIQDWPLVREWINARGGSIDPERWEQGDLKARSGLALAALSGRADDPVGRRLVDLLTRLSANPHRETAIFETYAFAVRGGELGDRPAYGLWGIFHAMQGPVNGVLPFAARVTRSDLPANDRTATLAILSLDSAVQIPVRMPGGVQRLRSSEFNIDGPFVKVQGSASLRAASRADEILMFDPGGENAPIRPGDFMTVRTSVGQDFTLDPSIPTSGYAQYVGVFRGSDWARPREDATRP